MSQNRQRAVAAVQAIKKFYAVGAALPKKASHKEVYDKGIIESAAEKLGMNPDTVRKARQFADPVAGYSRAELNALCQLITKLQPDQDERCAVFGRTHVIRLLSVQKRWRAAGGRGREAPLLHRYDHPGSRGRAGISFRTADTATGRAPN